MIILVLNCGSSSLKYQVLDMKNETEYSLLAKGLVERIGLEMGEITHRVPEKDKFVIDKPIPDHTEGIKSVLELLVDGEPVMEIAKLTEQDLALVEEFTEDDYMERYTYNFVRAE